MTEAAPSPFPQAVLVAIDFSPSARRALDLALQWYPRSELTVLHVVDTEFAARVAAEGLGASADLIAKRRARAAAEFEALAQEKAGASFETMIVEGAPFVEVAKLARDLAVDLVIMGVHGTGSRLDELLFGSTAEKVLRTSPCPVLCVP